MLASNVKWGVTSGAVAIRDEIPRLGTVATSTVAIGTVAIGTVAIGTVAIGTVATSVRAPSRRPLAIVVIAGCLIGLIALAAAVYVRFGHPGGEPVHIASPSSAPTCDVARSLFTNKHDADDGGPRVTVDKDPIGAKALWIPDINSSPCATALTTITAAQARRLAAAIRSAPKPRAGNYNCPGDTGVAVAIYFSYAGSGDSESVLVSLTGCEFVSMPGRSGRSVQGSLRSAIATVAPAAWLPYLGG
jgi:hypothetical protein